MKTSKFADKAFYCYKLYLSMYVLHVNISIRGGSSICQRKGQNDVQARASRTPIFFYLRSSVIKIVHAQELASAVARQRFRAVMCCHVLLDTSNKFATSQ